MADPIRGVSSRNNCTRAPACGTSVAARGRASGRFVGRALVSTHCSTVGEAKPLQLVVAPLLRH